MELMYVFFPLCVYSFVSVTNDDSIRWVHTSVLHGLVSSSLHCDISNGAILDVELSHPSFINYRFGNQSSLQTGIDCSFISSEVLAT